MSFRENIRQQQKIQNACPKFQTFKTIDDRFEEENFYKLTITFSTKYFYEYVFYKSTTTFTRDVWPIKMNQVVECFEPNALRSSDFKSNGHLLFTT